MGIAAGRGGDLGEVEKSVFGVNSTEARCEGERPALASAFT